MSARGLIVSAPRSSSGKTLVTLGLLGALSKGQIESDMTEALKLTDKLEAGAQTQTVSREAIPGERSAADKPPLRHGALGAPPWGAAPL